VKTRIKKIVTQLLSGERHNELLKTKREPKRPNIHSQNEEIGFYSSMFVEDLTQGIMPIGGESKEYPDFQVEFKGKSNQIERAKSLLDSLNYRGYKSKGYRNEEDLVSKTIRNICENIASSGNAVYEIFFPKKDQPALLLLPSNLIKLPFSYLYRPSNRHEDSEISNKFFWQYETFEVSIPRPLGGKRSYQKLINTLKSIKPNAPEINLKNLKQDQGETMEFDFDEFDRLTKLGVDEATKVWGWGHSSWTSSYEDKKWTEYYEMERQIKFFRSKAILRDHILGKLNNSLFPKLGYNVNISYQGIPSPDDINDLQDRLRNGELKFEEIIPKLHL